MAGGTRTAASRYYRGSRPPAGVCPDCGAGVPSLEHVFWECEGYAGLRDDEIERGDALSARLGWSAPGGAVEPRL
eukprot:10228581-Alexandrium_andersonii.AAC.1